jgi:hypothetical protein
VPFTAVVEELDTRVEFPLIRYVEFDLILSLLLTLSSLEAETDALKSTARSAWRKTYVGIM